jgi:low temperature requirement protein LtrA
VSHSSYLFLTPSHPGRQHRDGTPILTKQALLSYLSFFILVWWIWASQVAYNLRFRQSDWLHRIFVFLQLGIFSALAAFTRKFDITAGLLPDDDQTLTDSLMLQLGDDQNNLEATQFRDDRLPRLNARGVAMTMALSRLLLLVQYAVGENVFKLVSEMKTNHSFSAVCYHARRFTHRALVAHMAPLALSTLCFLISFAIIGSDASAPVPKSIEIAKIALWYIPMVFEIASYFLAHELRGRIPYPKEGVISRSGTVFIITLGGGLDKITKGFQFIVGNTGLGIDGAGVFASAAVIIVAQFSLYFGAPGSMRRLRGHRALAWFFAHFFYLAALIMMLQGKPGTRSFLIP